MKKLLTLILCWLLAFSAMAETTFKVKTALSVAGSYITSMNKVDGSFEDELTSWEATNSTITKTASSGSFRFNGNFYGSWQGTGVATLDLKWIATATNSYEASLWLSNAENDLQVCAVVNSVETGCKQVPSQATIKHIKVSVIADSVIGTGFYLRLKHTGPDAFNIATDEGKIEPWNLQNVQTVEQESLEAYGSSSQVMTVSVTNIPFNNVAKTSLNSLGTWTNNNTYTAKKRQQVTINAQVWLSSSITNLVTVFKNNTEWIQGDLYVSSPNRTVARTFILESGDYINLRLTGLGGTLTSDNGIGSTHRLILTATAISDNVVQSYSEDRIGETLYSINPTAPNGYIPAMGQSIGKTSGTYQGEAYLALYKVAWNYATTTAGEPYVISSAKGASAQADFDANKTITIDKRGLFVRTVGGNSGAVGAKQADAFQGHKHTSSTRIGYGPTTGVGANGAPYNANLSYLQDVMVGYSEDSTYGIPRVDNETRSINTAEYAYVRYAQSMPTLLALPTRSELFSANISASGTTSNATQNFVTSCTNATPSVCSLWSNFGVTPICYSHPVDITKRADVSASTATTTTVQRTDTSTAFNLFCHLK